MFGTALVLAGAAYAAYRLFPEPLFDFAVSLQRRASGLTLKYTTVDQHRVPYLEGGQGEPLLLLHGFSAEKDHWTQIAKYLTPHFRVIAPDVPGFGESSRLNDASYDLDHQLQRIEGFIAALGLSRVHLGGNSLGAYLAAMYAAHSPNQVMSLWLLAPPGVAAAVPSELLRKIEKGDNLLIMDSEITGRRLSSMLFSKAPFVPEEFKKVWLKRGIANHVFNAKIFHDLFDTPITLDDRCSGVTTPTFIVWGDDDRLLDVSGAPALAKLLPNAEVRIMRAMGHCPMLERPRATAEDYLNFQRMAL